MNKKERKAADPNKVTVSFVFDPEMVRLLKEEASRESRSASNMLNLILQDRYKPKK